MNIKKKIKKVPALSKVELKNILGGIKDTEATDSKDCTSGLGSGNANTDYDC